MTYYCTYMNTKHLKKGTAVVDSNSSNRRNSLQLTPRKGRDTYSITPATNI